MTSKAKAEVRGHRGRLDAARAFLIRGGIADVKVDRIAPQLQVTRGGFYWFFDSPSSCRTHGSRIGGRRNTEGFESVLRASREEHLRPTPLYSRVLTGR